MLNNNSSGVNVSVSNNLIHRNTILPPQVYPPTNTDFFSTFENISQSHQLETNQSGSSGGMEQRQEQQSIISSTIISTISESENKGGGGDSNDHEERFTEQKKDGTVVLISDSNDAIRSSEMIEFQNANIGQKDKTKSMIQKESFLNQNKGIQQEQIINTQHEKKNNKNKVKSVKTPHKHRHNGKLKECSPSVSLTQSQNSSSITKYPDPSSPCRFLKPNPKLTRCG
jgi:hypothetical protein